MKQTIYATYVDGRFKEVIECRGEPPRYNDQRVEDRKFREVDPKEAEKLRRQIREKMPARNSK